jgi:hypothetical protein
VNLLGHDTLLIGGYQCFGGVYVRTYLLLLYVPLSL